MIKVLIVDDDNELLEMVSLVLSSRNMDVTTLNHAVNIQLPYRCARGSRRVRGAPQDISAGELTRLFAGVAPDAD